MFIIQLSKRHNFSLQALNRIQNGAHLTNKKHFGNYETVYLTFTKSHWKNSGKIKS